MAPPLPERRLRNRSVCCLYPTPPPYPGHYRQPLTTAGLTPNLDTAKLAFTSNGDSQKGDLTKVISTYIDKTLSNPPNTGYRNLYGRHRSAPRSTQNKDDDKEEPSSRVNVHQARARREFFDQSNQQQSDGIDYGQTIKGQEATTAKSPAELQKQSSEGMHHRSDDTKPPKDRRRKNVSKASSGYNSLSSGESDAAEDVRNSNGNDYSPQNSVLTPETPQSYTTGTSSSSLSSYASKSPISPSRSDYLNNLRSTFTDEILRVLEQDGLVQQAPNANDTESPLPTFMADRRSSSDYNVIELSKKYRKKEINQMKAMEKVQSISDATQLQRMLDASNDDDQRLAIKNRLTDLKIKQNDRQATPSADQHTQLDTNVDVHQQKETTPEEGVKENKKSPVREGSPSVGGIASLTRGPTVAVSNGNGSSAAMNTQDTKSTTTKIVARSASEIKSALLRWCQAKTKGYPHVNITNYSKSWCDGMAFCALIHHFYPDAFDYSKLDPKNRRENFELSFRVAEQLGDIPALLEVDDILSMGDNPDYKCIFTYVQQFYRRFHNVP